MKGRGLPQSKRKKWECLFCYKKVGIDRKTRTCTESIFNSCYRHLPCAIIGKSPTFEEFKKNNGPFCALCYESAQTLAKKNELLTIVEKEIGDFVTSLTVSILENRNASVTVPLDYQSNIEIQMLQREENCAIEVQEEPVNSPGIFDCYEEEVQEVEVQKKHTNVSIIAAVQDEENDDDVQEMDANDHQTGDFEGDADSEAELEKPNKRAKGFFSAPNTQNNSSSQVILKNVVLRTTQSGKVFLSMTCECGMSFENDAQMKEHGLSCAKINTNLADTIKKPDIRYRCGVCGFLAKTIVELRDHKILRHGKKYACKKCDEKFRLNVQLKAHRRTVHRRERFQCSMCEKSFYSQKLLSVHEDEHKAGNNEEGSSEKPKGRKCEVCGIVCATKTMLNYHMVAKHTEERPYECSVCQRTFKLRRFLELHMQTHLQVKDFLCGDKSCGKSFSTFRFLEQHNKLEHTYDNFKCKLCDYRTLIQKKTGYSYGTLPRS